ncbi:tRNA lysidine(34) synthetase TilS [Flavobacteriales bacterium]|nr:tRNA lysidine(34) synthetase TilS [Flavobacteriales bacterium]
MKNKFLHYINEHKLFDNKSKILLAISGGIDSVCLANIFIRLEYDIELAHCNFKLREGESDQDETFVSDLANKYKIPFHSISFETNNYALSNKLSIQMAARDLRYKWLEKVRQEISADYIAIAHNQNDNIETFFINIINGTGLKGLRAIQNKNNFIVRPLMFASRDQIEEYVKSESLNFREDSSNISKKYLRNKVRHDLIPLLKELNPSIENIITDEIEIIKNTYSIFKEQVDRVVEEISCQTDYGIKISKKELLKLKPINTYLYETLNAFGFSDLKSIKNSILTKPGKQFFSKSHRLLIDREFIFIEKIEDRFFKDILIDESTLILNSPLNISFRISSEDHIDKIKGTACFDYERLVFPLVIRKWKSGDKFIPSGMKGFKKLSDFFIDNKINRLLKEKTLLLCSNDDIIWVIGSRIDERYKATSKTKKMYIANLLDK